MKIETKMAGVVYRKDIVLLLTNGITTVLVQIIGDPLNFPQEPVEIDAGR